MSDPFPGCVGQVGGVWVRALEGNRVALGVNVYTAREAKELAGLLLQAAHQAQPDLRHEDDDD